MFSFGMFNPTLTASVRSLALSNSAAVRFTRHAEAEMDNDGFDHSDVIRCLQKGNAFGPEMHNNQLRANVLHRGLHIRVVIAGLDGIQEDWTKLEKIKVITVMVTK
jgi:hypothetical protein